MEDFELIVHIADVTMVVVVNPQLSVSTISESANDPEVIESMHRVGVDKPSTQGKDAFINMFQADSDRREKVIKDNNITLD